MNWIKFLTKHNINYIEKGPSTAKGNVYINCVFCGDSDKGFHLGISIDNKGWGCWKNTNHRGRSPVKLIQRLLKCTWEDAKLINDSSNQSLMIPSSSLTQEVNARLNSKENEVKSLTLEFPPEFKLITNKASCKPFLSYLQDRLYSLKEALELSQIYQLHYSSHELFTYRVIVPVFESSGLVTFTGRHVGSSIPKYKTLSTSLENSKITGLPRALLPTSDCLLNFDQFTAPATMLVICEGPFDALRLDYYGKHLGIRATCLFGKTISKPQIAKLAEKRHLFSKCSLLLDKGTEMDSVSLIGKLNWLNVNNLILPQPWKDPGEMEKKAILDYFSILLNE